MNEKLVIAENNVAKMVIVVEENTSLTTQFAAEELSRYLTKITGGEFPVREDVDFSETGLIILGKKQTAKKYNIPLDSCRKQADSYILHTKGADLFLLGNNDRGLLYSIYAFLANVGAKWLEPGAAGEEIPTLPTLKIGPTKISDCPVFDYRGVSLTACGPVCPQVGLTLGEFTEQQMLDLIDWMTKQKQNYLSFMSSRIEIENRGWMPLISLEMGKRSLMLTIGGHSWVNAPYGLGDKWYEKPENLDYIAMINGERKMPTGLTQEMTAHARTQLCVSNEKGVKKVIKNAIAYLTENPQIDVLALFAADNINHWCECENCLKHSPTDLYLKFIFQLGDELAKRFPEKMLQFAPYLDTMIPPKKTDLSSTPDNLMMLFCRFSQCEHTFESVECTSGEPINFSFPRNKIKIPSEHINVWYNASLKEWLKHYHGPVVMLDYSHFLLLNSSRRGDLLFPHPETLQTDLLYYHEIGIAGHISVIHSRFSWPNALDMHLLLKLNWDPEIDIEETTREYHRSFYKKAGEMIGAVLSELRVLLDEKAIDKKYVDTIEGYWNKVKELQTQCHTEKVGERINRFGLYLEYILLRKRFNYFRSQDDRKHEATACLRQLFDFYSENQSEIQPYYEILDLFVKKNFEFS